MNHRDTEGTETRTWRTVVARLRVLLVLAGLARLSYGATAAPKAVLFISSAETIRDVLEADAPVLQGFVRDDGVAVMASSPGGSVSGDWLNGHMASYGGFAAVAPRTRLEFGPPGMAAATVTPVGPGFWSDSGPRPDVFVEAVALAGERSAVVEVDATEPDSLMSGPRSAVLRAVGMEDKVLAAIRSRFGGVPIIAIGPNVLNWIAISSLHGRLTSDTTRAQGVVSNLDVAPTLAAMVTGRAPADTAGHVIRSGGPEGLSHSLPKPVAATIRLQEGLGVLAGQTFATDAVIAFGSIALIALGTALCGGRGKAPWKRWVQRAMLVSAAAPIGVAVSASRLAETPAGFSLLAAAVTAGLMAAFILLGLALSSSRDDTTLSTLQVALGALCAFIIADVARHGMALRLSPLSGFFITGVRFYGIGNEYTSLFIASFTLVGLLSFQRAGTERPGTAALAFLGLWYALCAAFVGWPSLGANMGGMVIALFTGGVTWWLAARKAEIRLPWLWPLVGACACVGLVVLTDARSAHATHVGAFVTGATSDGRLAILLNKAWMNLRIVVQPVALLIYAISAAFFWDWWRRLAAVRIRAGRDYAWVALGVRSVIYGGFLALFTKDTGVVMLGLMVVVAVGAGVMLALDPPRLTLAPLEAADR